MLLWCIFLVFAFSIGLAEKNCNRTRVIYPAPVFGAGDNLSADKCGVWDQQINEEGPWLVVIGSDNNWCWGTLISPTSVLMTYWCVRTAKEFADSENKDDFKARLGNCAHFFVYCERRGEGQILKIKSVTKLNAPGLPRELQIWKIEKATLKENYIAPICLSNKGNLRDFDKTQNYAGFGVFWSIRSKLSAESSEDFGPCLNQGYKLKTCDKVDDNFLCARLSKEDHLWRDYLSHQENNRHFLSALVVEETYWKRYHFYYDLFPLLEQISSVSGDISLMPQIPLTKKKTVFKDGQSYAGCGQVSTSRRRRDETTQASPYIIGGEEAHDYEHPWHVAFVLIHSGSFFCGGTLLSDSAVLTAAHCVVTGNNRPRRIATFKVILGAKELETVEENETNRQERFPRQVIAHSHYRRDKHDHDVAIILLKEPVTFTSFVKPVCLWKDDYQFEKVHNATAEVFGWGYDENRQLPDRLLVAEVRVVPYQECVDMNRHFYNQHLKPGFNFCAGGSGVNTCLGDSGGGLSIAEGGRWYLRGVVSFGHTVVKKENGSKVLICRATYPAVYTDVTTYMDWIVQNAGLSHRIQN